ncbi:MAG: DUF1028 domain-containing protein [Chloroflexota bacterium]|nr:DUF1028 domain-containing protein [Chloroflexota bacterium]
MTYSIVAADPANGDLGVAVQSRFLAVGSLLPWASADAGAVATQALADVTIGPRGLELLRAGVAPADCIERLLDGDPMREQRQFGLVAADGRPASFTGRECFDHASSLLGDGFAAQGNILAGRAVVEGLASGFLAASGRPLADRLLTALEGAQAAGGDRRGQESAALLVVREGGGYGGNNDRMLDLRADDHPTPIAELRRLLDLHRLYFDRPDPADALPIEGALRKELEVVLTRRGFKPDAGFRQALLAYFGWENLEERWLDEHRLDPAVLAYIHENERELS